MKTERNRLLVSLYMENHTLQEVGDKFGITRERVRQILNEEGIKPRSHTGVSIPSPPKRVQTFSERFWASVQIGEPSECWEYKGWRWGTGYGRFASMGKVFYAHRLAFMLHHRKSPQRWILHKCDNPPCVNPDHLYDGTPMDNTRDRIERGRSAYQKDPEGWRERLLAGRARYFKERGSITSPSAKLVAAQVSEIKLALQHGVRRRAIAAAFGVSKATIDSIAQGRNWGQVKQAEIFSSQSPLLVLTGSTKSA